MTSLTQDLKKYIPVKRQVELVNIAAEISTKRIVGDIKKKLTMLEVINELAENKIEAAFIAYLVGMSNQAFAKDLGI
jgi:hypothetical protein